jgi:hypothetical protein
MEEVACLPNEEVPFWRVGGSREELKVGNLYFTLLGALNFLIGANAGTYRIYSANRRPGICPRKAWKEKNYCSQFGSLIPMINKTVTAYSPEDLGRGNTRYL